MKESASKRRIQKEILLQLDMTGEKKLRESVSLQEEIAEECNISPALPTLLYHLDDLTQEELREFHQFFQENFSHLSPSLPVPLQYEFLSGYTEGNLEEIVLNTDKVTNEELEEARETRECLLEKDISMSIGEILIHSGNIDASTLRFNLMQNKISNIEATNLEGETTAPPDDQEAEDVEARLGEIAVDHQFISEQQLDQALSLQEQFREKGIDVALGEMFISLKFLTKEELKDLLKLQQLLRKDEIKEVMEFFQRDTLESRPKSEYLGTLAVRENLLKQEQLDECLKLQNQLQEVGVERKLGEILLEKNYLTEENLEILLEKQELKARERADEKQEHDDPEAEIEDEPSFSQIDPRGPRSSVPYKKMAATLVLVLISGAVFLMYQPWSDPSKNESPGTAEKRTSDPVENVRSGGKNASDQNRKPKEQFLWERERSRNGRDAGEPDQIERKWEVHVNGTVLFPPSGSPRVSYRMFLNHQYLAGARNTISPGSTSYQFTFEPRFLRNSEQRRIPPGLYQIQHQFRDPLIPLPEPLKIQLEPFLKQELTQILTGKRHWYRFSSILHKSRSRIDSFWSNWKRVLKEEHRKLTEAWNPLKTKLLSSLRNTNTIKPAKFKSLQQNLLRAAHSVRNTISKKRKKFVVVPYQSSTKQLETIAKKLPEDTGKTIKILLDRTGINIPDWLDKSRIPNQDTITLSLLEKQLNSINKQTRSALASLDSVHPYRSLKDVLRLEAWRLLQLRRIMNALQSSYSSAQELLNFLREENPDDFNILLKILHSYHFIHKTSLEARKHLKDESFAKALEDLTALIPVLIRQGFEDMLTTSDEALPSFLDQFSGNDNEFANQSKTSLNKKLDQIQNQIGLHSLSEPPHCKRCPDSY